MKPIVVSYSELDAFRQCGHKHELAYKQRWTPLQTGPALERGRIWHVVMELHYRALQAGATDKARHRAIAEYLLGVAQSNPDDADLIAWMFDGHEAMWGTDPDWEILEVEDASLLQLPNRAGRGSQFWLRMRLDLLVRDRTLGGKVWVVDHKSGKDLPSDKELDIADQFGLYTWGKRQQGTPVFGQVHSAARTYRHKTGDRALEERFKRSRLYKTDVELQTIAIEAGVTASTAHVHYRALGSAPRSPDEDRCKWRCPYTEACLMGRKGGDASEAHYLNATMQQLTEAEQLAERGYKDPAMPAGGGTDA